MKIMQFFKKKETSSNNCNRLSNSYNAALNGFDHKRTGNPANVAAHLNDDSWCRTDEVRPTYLPLKDALRSDLHPPSDKSLSEASSLYFQSLEEMLNNSTARSFYLKFMKSQGKENMVHFCFEVEIFEASSIEREKISSNANSVANKESGEPNATLLGSGHHQNDRTNYLVPEEKHSILSPTDCGPNFTQLAEPSQQIMTREAVTIFSKFVSPDANCPIDISEDLRNDVVSKICSEKGIVESSCFCQCKKYVIDVLRRRYYQPFLSSHYFQQYKIEMLTSSRVTLSDILKDELALFYFTEYLEQENAASKLQAWLAIENFQMQLIESKSDAMQVQADAMILYDLYFSLQARYPLGLDDKTRFQVESDICNEKGPNCSCFSSAKSHIFQNLSKVYLPQFVQSELYLKYLTELMTSIDAKSVSRDTVYLMNQEPQIPLTSNNLDTEAVSSRNTLLATADSSNRNIKKVMEGVTDDMRIDSILLDPDALWQRPKAGSLTLGHIDSSGSFISELDPEPDGHKADRKFFSSWWDREKGQEEMATQVAQMIVKDITEITSTSSKP